VEPGLSSCAPFGRTPLSCLLAVTIITQKGGEGNRAAEEKAS